MMLEKLEREVITVLTNYVIEKCNEGDKEAKKLFETFMLLGVNAPFKPFLKFLIKNWRADQLANEMSKPVISASQYYDRRVTLENIAYFIYRFRTKGPKFEASTRKFNDN